jgi:hypothetical protein
MAEEQKRIAFHFHPYSYDNHSHAVEKSEGGVRKRYLEGVASGPRVDEHGERMTERCIKSFMEQANSGDILLYADMHGFKATEDIGIMKSAEILPNGDWHISSSLYDESDGVDSRSVEVAQKLWKQVNGLPPYTRPRQKGFSIEGFVPDDGILKADMEGRRILDNVVLDGVVVVPRPAYKDSIAHAVYKALGENAPWVVDGFQSTLRGQLREQLAENEIKDAYYRKKYQIEDVFEQQLANIMCSDLPDKGQMLEMAFDEYKSLMIELILQSEMVFDADPVVLRDDRKATLVKEIRKTLAEFQDIRLGGTQG